MLIKVKTLTGKEIEIDIEPTDKVDIINVIDADIDEETYWKVERIKERVEEKEGIPPPQQRLIFSGKQMNDEKTAADYKVREWFLDEISKLLKQFCCLQVQGGSVLHLVLALRGGQF